MKNWWEEYAGLYSNKIIKGKMSNARIASMTGLSLTHAIVLARYCRRGLIPDIDLTDPRGSTNSEDIPSERDVPEKDAAQLLLDADYVYNKEDDSYVTFLEGVPRPLNLPGEAHREIIRNYSNYDGQPASINQIARTVGIPRNWLVKYLRVHGITHDSEPFTPEELMSRTDEELVEDALQLRRAAVYKKLEKAKWADIRNDALKWRDLETNFIRPLQNACSNRNTPNIQILPMESSETPFAGVMGLTDFHWGKYSDPEENWEAFNKTLARERLFAATEDLVARLHSLGRPEKLYVPVGSDFFHVDTDRGTSTKGTPQDLDGTPAEMMVSGCQLMEEWILTLTQVAPIELVLMSGNHDRLAGIAILLFLEGVFRNNPRVTVTMDRTPRVYRTYGKNLIGFIHGDGVKKTKDMAGHMAREASQWWHKSPYKTIYSGHLHHEKTETDVAFGVTRRQIPSLTGTDRWHALNGFVGSPKAMPLYIHDKERGLTTVLYSPV